MCLFPEENQQPVFLRKVAIFIGRETKTRILPTKINGKIAGVSPSRKIFSFRIIIHSTTTTTGCQSQECPFFCVTCGGMDLGGPPMAARAFWSRAAAKIATTGSCSSAQAAVDRNGPGVSTSPLCRRDDQGKKMKKEKKKTAKWSRLSVLSTRRLDQHLALTFRDPIHSARLLILRQFYSVRRLVLQQFWWEKNWRCSRRAPHPTVSYSTLSATTISPCHNHRVNFHARLTIDHASWDRKVTHTHRASCQAPDRKLHQK